MLEASLSALATLFTIHHLLGLLFGILFGILFAIIPGLGGVTALAISIPFVLDMETSLAIAFIFGLLSIVSTGDLIPSVLLGVPGTVSAQATILDGYPMALRGEADRAIRCAVVASIAGGLFGTALLVSSVPIFRPLILAIGLPEFFMIGLFGITMVATLSTGNMVRGLLSAVVGVILATVGSSVVSAVPRWSLGTLYLYEGVPLIPLVMGLFAIPEMIQLCISASGKQGGVALKRESSSFQATLAAVREVFRHWFLVFRSGVIGTIVGVIPGLGATVVDWFAYGHALATERGATKTFGKGDIRGVLAPESANNSKSGGELVPTLAFGIPGSVSMALVLSVLVAHNVSPGREMLTTHLDLLMLMAWSIIFSNVVGGLLILLATRRIAAITKLPPSFTVSTIFVVVTVASFQATHHVGDVLLLAAASLLGWFMKTAGWSRPSLVLAFVLTPLIENYLFISINRYGTGWVARPGVLVLIVLIVAVLAYSIVISRRNRKEPSPMEIA